jgi:crotonobetainyl-CoA:carnitine CoA-transferase CaiB-like acyl-CoA transferase
MSALLAGSRLLDATTALGAPLSRMLESFGAEVVRFDPVAGLAPLADADFLVESYTPTERAAAGLEPHIVHAAYPHLVHTSVSWFGSDGPYAGLRGSELVVSAMGGPLRTTGYPDRAPVKEALDACGFHACAIAVSGTMAAHYERGTSGKGQHVDVSVQEASFTRGTSGVVIWQFDRRKMTRSGDRIGHGKASVRTIWALKDGYCFHVLMTGRLGAPANQALSDWMDDAGFENPMRGADWLAYNRSTLPEEIRTVWEAAIDRFFRSRTRAEVLSEGRRRGINASVGQEPDDILADPHLRERGFWRELALEDGAVVETPAYYVKGAL